MSAEQLTDPMREHLLKSLCLKQACCKERALKRQCSDCSSTTSGFLELNHILLVLTSNLLACQLLAEYLDLILPISDKHPSFLPLFSFGDPYRLWYVNGIFLHWVLVRDESEFVAEQTVPCLALKISLHWCSCHSDKKKYHPVRILTHITQYILVDVIHLGCTKVYRKDVFIKCRKYCSAAILL